MYNSLWRFRLKKEILHIIGKLIPIPVFGLEESLSHFKFYTDIFISLRLIEECLYNRSLSFFLSSFFDPTLFRHKRRRKDRICRCFFLCCFNSTTISIKGSVMRDFIGIIVITKEVELGGFALSLVILYYKCLL